MTIDFHVDNLVATTINGSPYAPLTNPMTTKGDLIAGGVSGAPARLPVGSNGQVLTANSAAADGVEWDTPSSSVAAPHVNVQTGTSYTLSLTDAPASSLNQGIVGMNNAAANVLTVPSNASVAFAIGTLIQVCQLGAGQTSISDDGGAVVIENSSSATARTRYSTLFLTKWDTDLWVLSGDQT